MTIDEAKKYIQGKARENQVGHIPTDKLNIYFERAQLEVVDELWGQRKEYQNALPRTGGAERNQTVIDEMSPITTLTTLNPTVVNQFKGNQYTIPTDFMHLLNLERTYFKNATATEPSELRDVTVDLVSQSEYNAKIRSQIDYPTPEYPIAKQLANEWIVVTGQAATYSLIVTYVRKPLSPEWAYTVSGTTQIYDAGNSQDFELPETTHNDICERVLSYIGISTRDMGLYQASEQKIDKGV